MRVFEFSCRLLRTAIAGTVLTCLATAQTPPKPEPASPFDTGPAMPAATKQKPPSGPPKVEIKPYKDVITAEAKSQDGFFKVHRVEEKIYWEIPTSMLGRDLLWQTEVAETPSGLGYLGFPLGERVVRFERHDKKVFMRAPVFFMRAEGGGPVQAGVTAATLAPIVAGFNIETEGPDKSMVIDVTNVFLADQSEYAAGPKLGASGIDVARSYIDRVTAFPTNIETRAYLTLSVMPGGPSNVRPGVRPFSVTVLVNSSLALLPEKPMVGRYSDSRVGYFATPFEVYGSAKHRVDQKEFIERYRLEKKDPKAAVSDPVQPITFYVSREVPDVFRPWIKKAIEEWQPAFEQAGFSHAIIAKDAPTAKEDPTWDPEDARYSVVRWTPSSIENARGPHVFDPRSGEVISSHLIVYHNVLKVLEEWYFAQAGAVDPRASRLPLSDDMMGLLIEYVVAHEVGHTLGLTHNFKASSSYKISELRDPKFTKEFGLAASVMDYARFNYVAQPGDGAATIGKLGPYDKFAIEWGYKPVPSAQGPDDEKVALDLIASRQVNDVHLRFDGDMANYVGIDPTAQTEDLGDDPIEASRLGLLNIRRVAKMLIPATTPYGEDYEVLSETYSSILGQRTRELGHVVRLVGGVVSTDYHAGRGKDVFTPVAASRQAMAVRFLMEAMTMPKELTDPRILNKITPAGAVKIVNGIQSAIVQSLFSRSRVQRLQDNEAVNGRKAYTVTQLVQDVQAGVWSELSVPKPAIDVFRRALQRSYLDLMDSRINGTGATGSDLKSVARKELRVLAERIDKALPRSNDAMTTVHLIDSRKQIEKIIEGKTEQAWSRGGAADNVSPGYQGETSGKCFEDPVGDAIRALLKDAAGK